jgi:hypothetical protein
MYVQIALSPEDARHLERLVESSDFLLCQLRTSSTVRGAERFQYVITVESAGKRHSVQTMDEAGPEALGALLSVLRTASMGRKIVPNSGATP